MPSVALSEWDQAPAGLLETILEYRHFGRAFAIYEQDPKAKGPLLQLMRELDFEMAQEEIDGQ